MFDWKLPTHRRGFLGSVAGGAAAFGLTSLAKPLELAAATDQSPAKEDPAVTAWLAKIAGKHKIVYDAPEPNHGFAFAWSRVFYLTNNETGVADKDLSVVIILRHNSIPFAMKDEMWAKYKFGEQFSITDPASNAPSARNFLYKAPAGALPLPGMGIDELLGAGVLMGVCNMAIKFYSGMVAGKMNMTADAVASDWRANLLPGVQLLPSGVWAVNRTQEHGCAYCFAG
jgi:intracellular sulfur oxidation DsrE/DsrF family protein